MKKFKDFYGCVAILKPRGDGVHLTIKTAGGKTVLSKTYPTERGARVAMGKCSDGTFKEVSNA